MKLRSDSVLERFIGNDGDKMAAWDLVAACKKKCIKNLNPETGEYELVEPPKKIA